MGKIHANEVYKNQLKQEIIYWKNKQSHIKFVIMELELLQKNLD